MWKRWRSWVKANVRRAQMEKEMEEELRFHLDARAEDLMRDGVARAEAMRRARMEFGGMDKAKEECREARGVGFAESVMRDLRFGLRMLRKNPGFTAVAVLTLALGIGANTAIFSVVNAVLLKSLPFAEPDQLVMVWNHGAAAAGGDHTPLAAADLLDWRAQNHAFTEIAAFTAGRVNFVSGDLPEQIQAAEVTANFFAVLGVPAKLGRTFLPGEDKPGTQRVAILSERLWRRRFGGDQEVLGKVLNLEGEAYTVIGVVPAGLDFPSRDTELWTALQLQPPTRRGPYFLTGIGRLKKDVTLQAARVELNSLKTSYPSGEHGSSDQRFKFNAVAVSEFIVGDVRLALLVLLVAVTLVLVIAAVNVANLMLARSAARGGEMPLRTALGASRGRIIRQLLTESTLLGLSGGALGMLLAVLGVRVLLKIAPDSIPRLDEVGIDWHVLTWTALICVVTSVSFGLAPAWQAGKLSLEEALREGGRAKTEGASKKEWRSLLMVTELALAIMLLIGAGLLTKSFWQLQKVDSGVRTERVLTAQIPLRGPRYERAEQLDAFYSRLLERVQALPGVRDAALSNSLPPDSNEYSDNFVIEGRPEVSGQPPSIAYIIVVSPEYFRTLGIPLRSGRFFTGDDVAGSPRVSIISETTARQFFPTENPVGKRIRGRGEIVGVVNDVRYTGLADTMQPAIYLPISQEQTGNAFLSVKTNVSDALSLLGAVRAQIRLLDPELPVSHVGTLENNFDSAVAQPRFRTMLIACFAGMALALAMVGTYSVISYSVTQRTHELGIRMALGASRREVLRLVVGHGLKVTVMGLAAGIVGALMVTRLMSSLLYGVGPFDPSTFASVAVLLTVVALAACYVPARRAMQVEPTVALRYE